jgi:NAD(P)H-hydrate epimerase
MDKTKLLAGNQDLRSASQPRNIYGSKKENGRVMIIGGGGDYHGAPVLASNAAYNTLAALRIGTGYAFLYVPKAILAPARKLSPSLIVVPFGKDNIGQGNFNAIKSAIQKADSLVIGMGIGRKPSTLKMASRIISYAIKLNKKIVVDADAIYSIKRLGRMGKNVILTPQDMEFYELSGKKLDKRSLSKRATAAISLAKKLDSCVLLKGHDTIITDGKALKVVSSHSSSLATMGTGDVLSGIIGGYMATGIETFKAGVAGAYLHSVIGDLLHRKKGNHILSSDIEELIPSTLRKFDRAAG